MSMGLHRLVVTLGLTLVAVLVTTACGGAGTTSAVTPTPSPTPPPVVKTAMATVAGTSKTILTDPSGNTLYYETTDTGGKVMCTAACAATWPPLLVPAGVTKLTGDSGATGTLGSVSDANGTQITYNGWPLFAFSKDTAPGSTTGEGLANRWHVATPDIAAAT
jgi:predicted lipoprotein with Yx(FWY)xxD motif